MAKRTLNMISGNQGGLMPLNKALRAFALDKMRKDIEAHWNGFTVLEDFSSAFEKAESVHSKYYPDEPPISNEDWLREYTTTFVSAHLNQMGNLVIEYRHQDSEKFYPVILFEKFARPDGQTFMLDETISALNGHMYSLLASVENAFLDFIKVTDQMVFGLVEGQNEKVQVTAPRRDWETIDIRSNRLIVRNGPTYNAVQIAYKAQRSKIVKSKAELFAELMEDLLTFDQISGVSGETIVYLCTEQLKTRPEINLNDYDFVTRTKTGLLITLARNTTAKAKEVYLSRHI